MEAAEAVPFRGSPGWELNLSNPAVRAFSDADAADSASLGEVGRLSGPGLDYAPIWRIVSEAKVPLSDIEAEWTFERICGFADYLAMRNDYRSAWHEHYALKDDLS